MNKKSGSAWTPLVLASLITLTLMYMFEVYIPYIDKSIAFEKACNAASGVVISIKNSDTSCMKNEIFIEIK